MNKYWGAHIQFLCLPQPSHQLTSGSPPVLTPVLLPVTLGAADDWRASTDWCIRGSILSVKCSRAGLSLGFWGAYVEVTAVRPHMLQICMVNKCTAIVYRVAKWCFIHLITTLNLIWLFIITHFVSYYSCFKKNTYWNRVITNEMKSCCTIVNPHCDVVLVFYSIDNCYLVWHFCLLGCIKETGH